MGVLEQKEADRFPSPGSGSSAAYSSETTKTAYLSARDGGFSGVEAYPMESIPIRPAD